MMLHPDRVNLRTLLGWAFCALAHGGLALPAGAADAPQPALPALFGQSVPAGLSAAKDSYSSCYQQGDLEGMVQVVRTAAEAVRAACCPGPVEDMIDLALPVAHDRGEWGLVAAEPDAIPHRQGAVPVAPREWPARSVPDDGTGGRLWKPLLFGDKIDGVVRWKGAGTWAAWRASRSGCSCDSATRVSLLFAFRLKGRWRAVPAMVSPSWKWEPSCPARCGRITQLIAGQDQY